VKANVDASAQQLLADTGYRSEAVMAQPTKDHAQSELVIALWRQDKVAAGKIDSQHYPYIAQMAAKLQTEEGKAATGITSGSASRPMAGSRTCWRFASSACAGWPSAMPSSNSFAWR
jgi:hypothetical protein|tara:strand:- start:1957 stop:2307 length:351 start_codon:yes stop_codon:yes gene_type:complete